MARVTVLIPTFDHGPLLRYSIQTVQQQTCDDLEILVSGDGVPDVTRALIAELQTTDKRIRFFDQPKGPRHGEHYRHRILLEEATGEIVCYLSDDDLWLPEHVEIMVGLLEDADFAHTQGCGIDADGTIGLWVMDYSRPWYAQNLFTRGGLPHSFVAHTLDLYRRLPEGWATTPAGIPTDRNMWAKILRFPGLRVARHRFPTAALLKTPQRLHMTPTEREAELIVWASRVADPVWRAEFDAYVHEFYFAEFVRQRETLTRIYESRAWRWRDRLRGMFGRG